MERRVVDLHKYDDRQAVEEVGGGQLFLCSGQLRGVARSDDDAAREILGKAVFQFGDTGHAGKNLDARTAEQLLEPGAAERRLLDDVNMDHAARDRSAGRVPSRTVTLRTLE